MALALPFAGVERRSGWLRGSLLAACLLGLLASAPAWVNSHGFPLLPLARWFPIVPSPWDRCWFAAMLLALVLAAWFYRVGVGCFLALTFLAFCEDQNRGQPWIYLYWMLLALTLFPAPTAFAACRLAMSVVYLWSGVQKCNARFFEIEPAWFTAPAAHWGLPDVVREALRWGVAAAPFLEMGIGVAVWIAPLRRWAIGGVVLLHAFALLILGPLGYNYNWVVWPWNLAMPALVVVLFTEEKFWRKPTTAPAVTIVPQTNATAQKPSRRVKPADAKARANPAHPAPTGPRLPQAFAGLRRSKLALTLTGLYALMPVLSYFGWWDSYFSFALYSENLANANIFVSQAFADRLPPTLRSQVQKFQANYDPEHQGPFIFAFQAWAYQELHVPPISEPRNFRNIFAFLRTYSTEPGDLRMVMSTRTGTVLFYQGDEREELQAWR